MNNVIDLTPYLPNREDACRAEPAVRRPRRRDVFRAAAALAEIAASFAIVVCLAAAVAVFCTIL